MRIFDCHIHVQPWKQLRPEALAVMKGTRTDLARVERALSGAEEFLRLMDEERIERAALINYVAPDVIGFDETVNEWVTAFVRGHEDRLVAVGSVHPGRTRNAGEEVRRLFDLGIRMLKVHPPHQLYAANAYRDGDKALAAIYSEAQEAGRPVMIHTGTSIFPGARNRYSDPMAADDVAVDFPHLKLILAHAGRPLFMPTAAFLARRHPNVHLDLSGIPPRKLLEYLPRLEELSEKCLWGTDYPSPGVPSMRRNVDDFLGLPISEAAKEKILWSNGAAVIK
jgi:predicted TIM-barrel fold metal-dependent hydrolase